MMKTEIIIIITSLIVGFGLIISGIYTIVDAQVIEPPTTDRFFEKNSCAEETDDLAGITYTNGEELSYDTTGCIITTKVIHRWNELSNSDKNSVTNRLSQAEYIDITDTIIASQIKK